MSSLINSFSTVYLFIETVLYRGPCCGRKIIAFFCFLNRKYIWCVSWEWVEEESNESV